MCKVSRRSVLKGLLGGVGGALTGTLLPITARASSTGSGASIVYFFKYGGADGLNVISPVSGSFNDYLRGVLRPGVQLAEEDTISFPDLLNGQGAFSDQFALHFGFAPLIAETTNFRVMTCIGDTSKRASRSHSDATLNMQTLRAGAVGNTAGILARAADACRTPQLGFGSLDGNSRVVSGGANRPIALDDIGSYNWDKLSHGWWDCGSDCPDSTGAHVVNGKDDSVYAQRILNEITAMRAQGNSIAQQYRNAREIIDDSIDTVQNVLEKSSIGNYGSGSFANRCRDLFRMIWFGHTDPTLRSFIKFYAIGIGGWDMHSNVLPGLSNAVPSVCQAFAGLVQDLKNESLYDKVTVVQSSEFGRTTRRNQSNGVDHAEASNHYMFGGRVRGGRSGGNYTLGEAQSNNAFQPVLDSRAPIYAAIRDAGGNPSLLFSPDEWESDEGEAFWQQAFL